MGRKVPELVTTAQTTSGTARTIAQKIMARAAGVAHVETGDIVWVTPDLMIAHDLNYPRYRMMLKELGQEHVAAPERFMLTIDHKPYADGEGPARDHADMRADVAKYGIRHFFDLGRHGISHNLPVDHGLVMPGDMIVTSDTRSPALGAVGSLAVALGAGFVMPMAEGRAWLRVPETIRVELTGALRPGVMSRDVAQRIARDIGMERGDYRVIEFCGGGLASLDMDARQTLCNAMVDIGVKSAVVHPDAVTQAYAEGHGKPFAPVLPDEDAVYAERLVYDLDAFEPVIALPPDPTNVVPVREVAGMEIHQAYVGSCIGGKMEDLRAAAEVLRGRTIAPGVRFVVIPASHAINRLAQQEGLLDVFTEAGCHLAVGACGPCFGALSPLAEGEVCIGTPTRNETGRMGSTKATVMIANAATVAASAVAGRVADPAELDAL